MHYCPINLEPIADDETFSPAGLRSFHRRLKSLAPLELSYEDQLRQARTRSDKMSIQGVQPKLSAVLKLTPPFLPLSDLLNGSLKRPTQKANS